MLNKIHLTAIGYMIDNPLNKFGFTLPELLTSNKKAEISFDAIAYKVLLGNFLEKINKIELSKIYAQVEKLKKIREQSI